MCESAQDIGGILGDLGVEFHRVQGVDDAVAALETAGSLVLLGLGGEAIAMARAILAERPRAFVIGLSDRHQPDQTTEALRAGMADVVPRAALSRVLPALLARTAGAQALSELQSSVDAPANELFARSASMRVVFDAVQEAAASDCAVMICGEPGSGRRTVARAIHSRSARAHLVEVDCATLGADGDEVLFGTSSQATKPRHNRRARNRETIGVQSRFYEAQGGTLVVGHLLELPSRAQARFARLLRDREVLLSDERGPSAAGAQCLRLDVRVLAIADPKVGSAVIDGRLRSDLFHRLALRRIDVPPLRRRREDIPRLAAHFLGQASRTEGVGPKFLSEAAATLLAALPWRNNGAELRALLGALSSRVPGAVVGLDDVLQLVDLDPGECSLAASDTLRQARLKFEQKYIATMVQRHHGRIPEAARALGIQRSNLYRKLRHLRVPLSVVRERRGPSDQ